MSSMPLIAPWCTWTTRLAARRSLRHRRSLPLSCSPPAATEVTREVCSFDAHCRPLRIDVVAGIGRWCSGCFVSVGSRALVDTDRAVAVGRWLRSARVEVVGLDDVVGCGDQLPFGLDGFEAAPGEASVAALFFDGPEHRLDGVLSVRVDRGAFGGA